MLIQKQQIRVLEQQPANVEALTYKGWATYLLLGNRSEALTLLVDATTADPDYPAAHAFIAVLFFRSGLVQQASAALDRLDALDPPPDVLAQIEGLRQEVDAAMAALATSTSAGWPASSRRPAAGAAASCARWRAPP